VSAIFALIITKSSDEGRGVEAIDQNTGLNKFQANCEYITEKFGRGPEFFILL
jgi:hypothetical protein